MSGQGTGRASRKSSLGVIGPKTVVTMRRGGQRSMALLVALCVLVAIRTIRDTWRYYKYMSMSTTTTSTTTTTTTSDRHRHHGDVYKCGYDCHLDRAFGPEYRYGQMGLPQMPSSDVAGAAPAAAATAAAVTAFTPQDILIYGLYGPCPIFQIEEGADVINSTIILLQNFPGKILIVNAEPYGNVFEVIKAATATTTTTTIGNVRVDYNKDDKEMQMAGHQVQQLIRNKDGTVGTRLYQIGPYPPIIRTILGDKTVDGRHNDDDDMYVSLYNSHSLQVFYMALFMNKVFGPPPLSFSSVSQSTAPFATLMSSNNSNNNNNNNNRRTNHINDDNSTIQNGTIDHTIPNNIRTEVVVDPIWDWWIDPSQRRNNTAKYNAIAYFTRNCIPYRQKAARQLATIIPVHYPAKGGCTVLSSPGVRAVPIRDLPSRQTFARNYVLYHDYKYCLVMENTDQEGYITEKIANAYLGGCLPIYYGTQQIWDIFHNESFIFYDIHNPQPAMDLLRRLEADPVEYYRRLQEVPILKEGHITMQKYFSVLLKPTSSSSSSSSSQQSLGENGETKSSSVPSSSLSSLATTTTEIVTTSMDEETLNGRIRKMMDISE